MVNQLLITLTNSILGSGKKRSKGNYAYVCPFHVSNPPGKTNFEINFTENKEGYNKWACWGCGQKGKTLLQLFKKLNVSSDKLSLLDTLPKSYNYKEISDKQDDITLPKEFISLYNIPKNDIEANQALSYLKRRGINELDILRYNLGFCKTGIYSGFIIIPSYDSNGNLNYFSTRNYSIGSIRFRNPKYSRDIIPFEFFINWDLPIILCEGPFDAITIKRNVIPLLGKNLQPNLMKKILLSKVNKIYIAIDKDAQKLALNYCEKLMNEGKEIYLVDLKEKDPNSMGFENFTNLIQETNPLTLSDLIKKKIEL